MELLNWFWVMLHSLAYGVVLGLILALLFTLWAWRAGYGWQSLWGVVLAGAVVLVLAAGLGVLLPTAAPALPQGSSLRVAQLNTLFYTAARPEKLAFAARSGAQVVSLQEVNPALAAQLPSISGTYPFQLLTRDRLPMALLSIYPLTRTQAWGERAVMYHVARPALQGGAFYVLQAHSQSPYSIAAVRERDATLNTLMKALPNLPRPLLLVGDFNTVPWDAALAPLQGQFKLAGDWRGWLPSFPSFIPLTPIDHLWASVPHWPESSVQRVRVAGSDHVGLVVDFK